MRTAEILEELLAIGQSSDIWAVERLPLAGQARDIIKFSADFRQAYPGVSGLAEADRVALAKAAAALEHTVGGIGSVTVLHLIVNHLSEASQKDALDWILANTTSYAYYSHGTKSWTEFRDCSEKVAAARSARRIATAASEYKRAKAASERRAARATQNLPNAVRRGDKNAVEALLVSGASAAIASPDGTDLVEYASRCGHHEIAEILARARVA